jgi:hypothetical protein
MELHEVIWKDRFIYKIERKHRVSTEEVEQILLPSLTSGEPAKVMSRERICTQLTAKRPVVDI